MLHFFVDQGFQPFSPLTLLETRLPSLNAFARYAGDIATALAVVRVTASYNDGLARTAGLDTPPTTFDLDISTTSVIFGD